MLTPGSSATTGLLKGPVIYAVSIASVSVLVLSLALQAVRSERDRQNDYALRTTHNLASLAAEQVRQLLIRHAWQALAHAPRIDPPAGGGPSRNASAPWHADDLSLIGLARDDHGGWTLELQVAARETGLPPRRVQVPVDSLAAGLEGLSLGTGGALAVRTSSMALVYRHPKSLTGQDFTGSHHVSTELRTALRGQPASGSFTAVAALDGIARVNSFRQVQRLGLYVIVGLPQESLWHAFGRIDRSLISLAVLALLVTAGAAWQIHRLSRQEVDAVHRRFQAIVESSDDAIISKTLDGIVTSWNAAAQRIFGWSEQEMLGQPLLRIIPPDLHGEEASIIERVRRGEPVESLETERLHRDGHRVPMSLTISPVRDASGRIVGASKIGRDISRHRAMEAEVRRLAFLDPLTELPNRRLLADRMRMAQQAGHRQAAWSAVILLDLDSFKELNDRHGHASGDELLKELARRLLSAVRASDTVARMGGDEFLVLCPGLGTDHADVAQHAERIEAKIRCAVEAPWQCGPVTLVPRASLGHYLFRGAEESPDAILRAADARMYADKVARRGQAE